MKPKKLAVLMAVKQAKRPISIAEVMQELDDSFADRSVRRWLSELVDGHHIEKIGKGRATRYQAIISNTAITYIHKPLFEREPVGYQPKWLEEYQPNQTYFLTKAQQQDCKAAGESLAQDEIGQTYQQKIYHRLLIDLSFNSSRLEGNTYSRLETQQLLFEGKYADNKLDEEAVMILNHKEAIRFLVDNAEKIVVNEQTIYSLHYLLADGLIPHQYSGKVRDHSVRIGGSVYTPRTEEAFLQKQLHSICDKASAIINPFEQSLFLLAHLAYLQAFHDVNKRTSRLSANIPLIQHSLIPLLFNDVSKEDYLYAMLAIYELNDISLLAELYCHSYVRSCKQYHIIRSDFPVDKTRIIFRAQRREILSHIIHHQLVGSDAEAYLAKKSKESIPSNQQQDFQRTVMEDLRNLSPATIAGLGITSKELQAYLRKQKSQ